MSGWQAIPLAAVASLTILCPPMSAGIFVRTAAPRGDIDLPSCRCHAASVVVRIVLAAVIVMLASPLDMARASVRSAEAATTAVDHEAADAHGPDADHGTAVGDHHGAHGHAPHADGAELSLMWVVPFAGILLSIAIFPLVAPHFWHQNFGKVSAFWCLAFLIPFALIQGGDVALYEVLHIGLLEYVPFIILLLALFTIAGGVRLTGQLAGTPGVNLGILLTGTALASWMGTTGAAMLLIRPLLRANENRRYRVHTVIFFIFLVANIGGGLTPLGDPPLFLGFLEGIDFFWPTRNMLFPVITLSAILLTIYYIADKVLYAREGRPSGPDGNAQPAEQRLGLEGKINILLLGCVVIAVLMSGVWKPGIHFTVFHVDLQIQNIMRDVMLVGLAFLSLRLTDAESRRLNGFTWFPIIEVAKLFAGIFATIIPAIAILKAGTDGALSQVIAAVSEDGQPVNQMYFWLTGILSSFLDNAPTYLVFFNTAGGDTQALMGPLSQTLLAISMGAVFMGANTYIGNAPNFMVRAIAAERGIPMPSFFGYMLWSIGILFPIFVLVSLLYL